MTTRRRAARPFRIGSQAEVAAHAYFDIYADAAGKHRWRFKAANYQTLIWTTRGYSTRSRMLTNLALDGRSGARV